MLNNRLNSQKFASGSGTTTLDQDDIAINGFGLLNDSIFVKGNNDGTNNQLDTFDLPRDDGRGFLGYYNRSRNIKMNINVNGTDASDFQNNLDNLRKELFKEQSKLDWKIDGKFRRIKVNTKNANIEKAHYNINFLNLTVNFETVEPYWHLVNNATISFLGVSTSPFNATIDNTGTAKSYPLIKLTFATGLSNVNQIKVDIEGTEITINETINDNDVVNIDCENKEVDINGTVKDYDGIFPFLKTGLNQVTYTINGTFTVDINNIFKVNYV